MTSPGDNNPVLAHADGELTGAARAAMARRVASEPAVARQVAHQQQLREAVARVMAEPAAAPADLRTRLEMVTQPAPRPTKAPPAVLAVIGRWAPAALAAALFLAAMTVFTLQQSVTDVTVAGIMPVSQVQKFAKRHVACTHSIAPLYTLEGVPQQISALPTALSTRLGQQTPSLDLSAVGYAFERVGSCTIPGQNAVHLIYRAAPDTGRDDRVSLWMVPDDGRLPIEADRVFTLADSAMPHPMLVWRSGGLVYYLVGDAVDAVQNAAHLLAGSAATDQSARPS